mmetsp:Transcript_21855/g.44769  ORF Transcript_21855/g.44769 Transcript_21855/m.44769 type:complete len:93 (+) Transcript_21855:121-399(+)
MINEVFMKACVVLGQASGGLEQTEYHVVKFVDLFILGQDFVPRCQCKPQNQLEVSGFLGQRSVKPGPWSQKKLQKQLKASGCLVWRSAKLGQ